MQMGIIMRTRIIYEDDALLVIYKPAGIATQTSKIGQADVVSELKNYLMGQGRSARKAIGKSGTDAKALKVEKEVLQTSLKGKKAVNEVYLGIIHRLDQPVEGLLVFGKTKDAAAGLSAQLAKGTLNKQYYAVISGKPSEQQGELVDKLYKNSDNRAVVVTGQQEVPAEAKEAVLQYRIIESVHLISLADIHIDTGRFHQIRAQMAHHGMALLGDSKYAEEGTRKLSQQLFVRNVALCAYSLEVVHPVTKKQLSFEIKPEGRIFQEFEHFRV